MSGASRDDSDFSSSVEVKDSAGANILGCDASKISNPDDIKSMTHEQFIAPSNSGSLGGGWRDVSGVVELSAGHR